MKGRHITRDNGTELFLIDGKEVTKAEYDVAFPDRPLDFSQGTGLIGWKPLHSDSAAVHPAQIQEAMESARKRNVPTDFDGFGRPIFRSRGHRAQYLRAYGMYDRGASYGDPAPNHVKDEPIDGRVYDVES